MSEKHQVSLTPVELEPQLAAAEILRTDDGNVAVFMAVHPRLLTEDRSSFSTSFKLTRMSWLKTSPEWALWKAQADYIKRDQVPEGKMQPEEIIQVGIKPEEFKRMLLCSVSSAQPGSGADILRQMDPDRRFVYTASPTNEPVDVARKISKKTLHLGLKGEELNRYVRNAAGRIQVVTGRLASAVYGEVTDEAVQLNDGSGPGDRHDLVLERLGLTQTTVTEVCAG